MHKLFLNILLVILLSPSTALAQNDSLASAKKAAQLFELMGMEKVFDNVFKNVFDMQENESKTKLPEETRKAFLDEMILSMYRVTLPVFTKYFTELEIDELIAFYKTPVGKKSIQVTPSLTADIQIGIFKWVEKDMPIFQKKIEEAAKKSGKKLD